MQTHKCVAIKQCGQLHTYEDFVGVVEKVGTAVNMACSDFYSWPRSYGTSTRCKTERPLLEKVKVIRFQRGSVQMEWKSEHNEVSYRSAPFLRQKDERLIGLGVPIAWQVGRLAPDSLCTVPARSMQQQKNTPCTVPARSLHNEHLMHTPCTVSPCTLPARSMHGLCTVPAQ